MQGFWDLMKFAVGAAAVMSPVHALFGIHIVRRGLIFIDLAVAQVAALGMALAVAMGHEAHSPTAYQYSVGAALLGALLIALTRFGLGTIPHEAIIGVVYVFATAAAIVVLEFAPTGHGHEELKALLAGNIFFVQPGDVTQTAMIYGGILVLVALLWKRFAAVSEDATADRPGWELALTDFAFYALLGFVVASSVKIAGVLVVFAWLVMPAVAAMFFVRPLWKAALVAVPIGVVGSFCGLLLSYFAPPLPFDHAHEEPSTIEAAGLGGWATGPSIVIALTAIVAIAYVLRLMAGPLSQTKRAATE